MSRVALTVRDVQGAYVAAATAVRHVGFEAADASSDYHQQFPFAANGGLVMPPAPPGRFWLEGVAGKGIQLDKSAGATAVAHGLFQRDPRTLSAATKFAIWVPRTEAIGIELVGTGTPTTDQLSFHVRHVGFH